MKRFNIKYLSVSAFLMLLFSSCLKDKGVSNREYSLLTGPGTEGKEYVTIPKSVKTQVLSLESKTGSQDVPLFEVSYDYVNQASSDISVTVAVNNSLIASDATIIPLPTSAYSFPSTSVVISAGGRLSSSLLMKLVTDNIADPTLVYGLGFTITAVSKAGVQIPDNMKNVVYKFTVKNKYDGEYTVTGTMIDYASAALTGSFPFAARLITTGATTVDNFSVADNNYYVPIKNGAAASRYGGFSPKFKFDANNKIIEVTNYYGNPDPGTGRYAGLDPSGVNAWDPATKTIKVKFFMYQPSVIALPNARTAFDWTFTYKGSRK